MGVTYGNISLEILPGSISMVVLVSAFTSFYFNHGCVEIQKQIQWFKDDFINIH